jgi:predicted TPR repeat methyltransferase
MTANDANEPVDDLLAAAYALDGPDANRSLYARWATTYDSGFIVDSDYRYHERVAAVFVEHCLDALGAGDAVVDVGCGTGLAGHALRRHADIAIDGIDISPEMLQQAAAKRVYRRLIEADLTEPLLIDDDAYAGALSAGTFTHGHVGPDALHEIVRIVGPGGRLAIGVNAAHFATTGFAATLDDLVHGRRLADLQLIDMPIYGSAEADAFGDLDQLAHIIVGMVN